MEAGFHMAIARWGLKAHLKGHGGRVMSSRKIDKGLLLRKNKLSEVSLYIDNIRYDFSANDLHGSLSQLLQPYLGQFLDLSLLALGRYVCDSPYHNHHPLRSRYFYLVRFFALDL